jgi:hypothetical protein
MARATCCAAPIVLVVRVQHHGKSFDMLNGEGAAFSISRASCMLWSLRQEARCEDRAMDHVPHKLVSYCKDSMAKGTIFMFQIMMQKRKWNN